MKTGISIQERLKNLRVERKLKLEELAELTGISKSALGSYEADEPKEMNHKNLIALADFYQVSVDSLLCRTENRNHPNTPLTELHLSDAMVELLKSGNINNRLLCELAIHEKFAELMADAEIYMDGLDATNFISLLFAQARKVVHSVAPPLPTKSADFAGIPYSLSGCRRASSWARLSCSRTGTRRSLPRFSTRGSIPRNSP